MKHYNLKAMLFMTIIYYLRTRTLPMASRMLGSYDNDSVIYYRESWRKEKIV